jgi:hypothetical protein
VQLAHSPQADAGPAAACAERAFAALTDREDLEVIVTVFLARAKALVALGRTADAKLAAAEARATPETKAARIADPAARAGFLHRNVGVTEMLSVARTLLEDAPR